MKVYIVLYGQHEIDQLWVFSTPELAQAFCEEMTARYNAERKTTFYKVEKLFSIEEFTIDPPRPWEYEL